MVSVDTRRAEVARACLDAGARIVNDVSALRDDPALLPLVVQRGAPVVLMHRRGRPEDKYEGPAYRDVVEDVRDFLLERAAGRQAAGVARDRIALDPGIGFGKSVEENMALIAGAGRLAAAGYPVLVGVVAQGLHRPADRDRRAAPARSGVGLAGGRGGPAGRRHPAGARRRRDAPGPRGLRRRCDRVAR